MLNVLKVIIFILPKLDREYDMQLTLKWFSKNVCLHMCIYVYVYINKCTYMYTHADILYIQERAVIFCINIRLCTYKYIPMKLGKSCVFNDWEGLLGL